MLKKILFIFICFGLFLNQVGRINLQNDVAFSLLDVAVGCFTLYATITIFPRIREEIYAFPKVVFFLLACALLSTIVNWHNYTMAQNISAFLYFLRFCEYIYAGIIIRLLFHEKKDTLFILASLAITALAVVLTGFIQYAFYTTLRNLFYLGWDNHMYRLYSTFLDPNFAATFFSLAFFLLVGIYISTNAAKVKVLFLVIIALVLISLFLTFSRSGLIMLLIGSFIFFWNLQKKKYTVALILFLLVTFIVVAPKFNVESTDYFRTNSSNARVVSATIALNIIQRNPLFGVGFDAYRYAQENYRFQHEITPSGVFSHADAGTDNSFLFVLATVGPFGFISYVIILVKLLKKTYEERKKYLFSTVFFASLIGVILDSLFINALFYPTVILWLGAIYATRDYT